MSNFKSFTLLSLLTFTCLAVYASTPSESLIIETENKTIEAILKTEDTINTKSDQSLDKETLSAVLCIITNFLSEKKEVLDQATIFNLTTFDGPPGYKGLEGTITDDDGITSVKIEYSDTTFESSYVNGNINAEGAHASETTYTITVTDDNGVVKTKTGTL